MLELRLFERDVYQLIHRSRIETNKINSKIDDLKKGQLESIKMILSLQQRLKELEIHLGESSDWYIITYIFKYKIETYPHEGLQHIIRIKVRQQNRSNLITPRTHLNTSSSSQTEPRVSLRTMEFLGKSWWHLQKLLRRWRGQLQRNHEIPYP